MQEVAYTTKCFGASLLLWVFQTGAQESAVEAHEFEETFLRVAEITQVIDNSGDNTQPRKLGRNKDGSISDSSQNEGSSDDDDKKKRGGGGRNIKDFDPKQYRVEPCLKNTCLCEKCF